MPRDSGSGAPFFIGAALTLVAGCLCFFLNRKECFLGVLLFPGAKRVVFDPHGVLLLLLLRLLC